MNTPSGELRTAVDRFVYKYVEKGYTWDFDNDDIIFSTDDGRKLLASAQYDDKHWINGFIISEINK